MLALQILAIDLLAEVAPLTCLTFDPPQKGVMRSSPRDRGDHIMNPRSSPEVLLLGALIGGLAFANYALGMFRYVDVPFSAGLVPPYPEAYMKATTLAYLTIAFCQFVNIMSRRFRLSSIFNRNFFSNRVILWSIAASIAMILIAVYVPFIGRFVYFSGPRLLDWVFVIGAALVYLAVFELMKALKRSRHRAGTG
jgi:Ca2+-transporting ATPase